MSICLSVCQSISCEAYEATGDALIVRLKIYNTNTRKNSLTIKRRCNHKNDDQKIVNWSSQNPDPEPEQALVTYPLAGQALKID